MDKPLWGLRVDGASPRGLWPPVGGRLCRRVVKGKVLKMDWPSAQGFLSLTALRAEGCGGGFAADYKKRGAAGAAGCLEGLHRSAQEATAPKALRVADCRSAAMLIKSALRDLLSVSYGMKTILLTGSLRSPPPIRLRRTSPRESVSHDSQVASLPYESCSLATPVQGEE